MPVIGLAIPDGDWRTAQIAIGKSALKYGSFLGESAHQGEGARAHQDLPTLQGSGVAGRFEM